MIDVARLIAAGVSPTQARLFLDPLSRACARFAISSPARQGHFVAQCWVESAGFVHLEENCYWTTPERIRQFFPHEVKTLAAAMTLVRNPKGLANTVYAGKDGNGDVLSGDGWTYRGRGLIDLTGKGNYHDAGTGLGRPYLASPELVALPEDACLTAAWFWDTHKCNALADAGLSGAITRQVNGPALEQAALRQQRTQEAIAAFS